MEHAARGPPHNCIVVPCRPPDHRPYAQNCIKGTAVGHALGDEGELKATGNPGNLEGGVGGVRWGFQSADLLDMNRVEGRFMRSAPVWRPFVLPAIFSCPPLLPASPSDK